MNPSEHSKAADQPGLCTQPVDLDAGFQATTQDILYAYRLLLGREPEPEGVDFFKSLIMRTPMSPDRLARFFMDSSEFFAKYGHVSEDEIIEVPLDGYSMFVRTSDRDIGVVIDRDLVYEPHVTSALDECLTKGMTFVDVGANIGYFAAFAACRVGSSGRVIVLEPLDKNLQLIYATIWKNHFDWIEVFPYAAGASTHFVSMSTGPRTSNAEIMRSDATADRPNVFAPVRKLDDLLANLDRADIVKFDIEGYEPYAWRGFQRGLQRLRPLIFTEFHPYCLERNTDVEPADYLKMLFEYGREVEVLHDDGGRICCASPEAVLAEWRGANAKRGAGGAWHLDLRVLPRT